MLRYAYKHSDREGYKINVDNVHLYRKNMNDLKKCIFIWPDFNHVDTIGSKGTLYEHLNIIARAVTRTTTLQFEVLKEGDKIKSNVMLKRSHSDAGEHVLGPLSGKQDWKYLSTNMKVPGCYWIAQKYCKTLIEYGEWRVFILGGRIFYVVHTLHNTTKGTWNGQKVTTWYTLDELR
jgi:hypothetical protein